MLRNDLTQGNRVDLQTTFKLVLRASHVCKFFEVGFQGRRDSNFSQQVNFIFLVLIIVQPGPNLTQIGTTHNVHV